MMFVFYPNLFDYLTLISVNKCRRFSPFLWPVASGKREVVIRWRLWLVNPLSPNGDQHQISPSNINAL